MSGAETMVETALRQRLTSDAGVQGVAGLPVRLAGAGEGRPAYPFLELSRHEARRADSQDAPASEHLVDLAVVSRNDAGAGARAGAAAVRAALDGGLTPASGRCVLVAPLFVTVSPGASGTWRALVRIRIVFEPD